MQRRNLNSITDQLEITHHTKLGSVLDAIWGSTRVLIRVVRYLLDELRVERRLVPLQAVQEGVEVDMEDVPMDLGTTSSSSEGTGRQSMESSSRPTTPGDNTSSKPLTLLDIINQSQSPGCKRKRSMTHIGSICIASIVPPSPLPLTRGTTPFDNSAMRRYFLGGSESVTGRAVANRKKVGLGRLFSGMGVGSGHEFRRADADGVSDEESESEDEDLIVII